MQVLSGSIIEKGITAKDLRGCLDDLTRETLFWESVPPNSVASIPIKRLNPPILFRFKKKPAGYVVFRASLSDDLDGLQISNWLKTNAPLNATAAHIETTVLSKFCPSAQLEIIRHLQSLDVRMAAAASVAHNPFASGDGETIKNTLDTISSGANAAQISIETPLLLDTNVTIKETAIKDDAAILPGTLDSISIHDRDTCDNISGNTSFAIMRGEIKFQSSDDRFIIDFFEYEPGRDGKPQSDTIEQVERVPSLLCHRKDLGSHILPGIGYIHEEARE
ncbi:hypothetical protein GQ44DRAFT_779895 [Phaeosphaeriaceae sp. PMI808]|nr:hypothetical protein GQ44DRAFT_779895 [Phaeosphaeriaceae sp. PMI808]